MTIDRTIIEEKAKKIVSFLVRPRGFDDQDFITNLQALTSMLKDSDKIKILNLSINRINKYVANQKFPTKEKIKLEKDGKYAIYLIEQEIEKIKPIKEDKSSKMFTDEELEKVYEKLDEILHYVKINDVGHEVLYDEINKLKDKATKLTSKDFKLLFLGIIGAFGGGELTDFIPLRELFEIGRDYVIKYLNP